MSAGASPPFGRLREWLARVCPAPVVEHVVDQTLADLASERERHLRTLPRGLATAAGLAHLLAALGLSLILLRHHWRLAPWWPPANLARESAGWIVLLTLLTVARVALMRPEYARLGTLSPDFIVMKLVPIALPAAALGLALMAAGRRRLASVALVALGTTTLSAVCAVAIPAGLRDVFSPDRTVVTDNGTELLVHGRPMEPDVWERFQAQRARSADRHRHVALSMVAFCITLPALAVALTSLLRRSAPALVALAFAAVALGVLLEWRTALPPPMTTQPEAILAAWRPHLVLAGVAAILGSLARVRSRACRPASI